MNHIAKKRFGQHFLSDQSVIERIVQSAELKGNERVLEVGPGQGVLTDALLKTGCEIVAVEIDRDLIQGLRNKFQDRGLRLIEGDILELDWAELFTKDKPNRIIANLPYNISSPFFFKIIAYREWIEKATLMLQKEVAQRIVHQEEPRNIKDYGILSVVAYHCFKAKTLFEIPPESFRPPPKVHSQVIQLESKNNFLTDETAFFDFIRKAFGHRRQTLLKHLKRFAPELVQGLSQQSLDDLAGLRPENLSPGQFLRLYEQGVFSKDQRV